MAREISNNQNYIEKLLRLIPSEIIAAYLIIIGIIPGGFSKWGGLIITVLILALIPFYLWRVQNVKNYMQITATAAAYLVWVYSLNGGPFQPWGLYRSWLASIILILWTLIIPVLVKPSETSKKTGKVTVAAKPKKASLKNRKMIVFDDKAETIRQKKTVSKPKPRSSTRKPAASIKKSGGKKQAGKPKRK